MNPAPARPDPQPYRSWSHNRWMFDDGGAGGLVILMYHKIGQPLAGSRLHDLYVGRRAFDRQMSEFAAAGQRPVPYGEALATIEAGGSGFCLTFDDAFANVFDHALPILRARGLRAMLFVVARADRQKRRMGSRRRRAAATAHGRTPDQRVAGRRAGNRRAHPSRTPHLAEIPPAQARAEIFDGKKRLEDRFGVPVRHFCYPYGNYDARVRDLVAEAGYASACITARDAATFGANRPGVHPLELRRIMACNGTSPLRAAARKVARLMPFLRPRNR